MGLQSTLCALYFSVLLRQSIKYLHMNLSSICVNISLTLIFIPYEYYFNIICVYRLTIYQPPRNLHMVRDFFYLDMFLLRMSSPVSLRITSLLPGVSYDCSSSDVATLKRGIIYKYNSFSGTKHIIMHTSICRSCYNISKCCEFYTLTENILWA